MFVFDRMPRIFLGQLFPSRYIRSLLSVIPALWRELVPQLWLSVLCAIIPQVLMNQWWRFFTISRSLESDVLSLSAHSGDLSKDNSHKPTHVVKTLFHGGKCGITVQQLSCFWLFSWSVMSERYLWLRRIMIAILLAMMSLSTLA